MLRVSLFEFTANAGSVNQPKKFVASEPGGCILNPFVRAKANSG
jgi:hypothetical protein